MVACLDREEAVGPFISGDSEMVEAFVRRTWPHLCSQPKKTVREVAGYSWEVHCYPVCSDTDPLGVYP